MRKERIFSLGSLLVLCCLGVEPLVLGQNTAREAIETPANLSSSRPAKGTDPSSIHLEVFQLSSAGERLAKEGDDKAALSSFLKAEALLKVLAESHPEWSPNVVRYRRELNAKTIRTLKARIQEKESRNPARKADFLDNNLINPERPGTGTGTVPSVEIRDRSTRELSLEKRLREVLEELNQLKAQNQSATDALAATTRENVARDARMKELEKQLLALRNTPKSEREQQLEKELTELRKYKDTNSSDREKQLETELNALKSASLDNRNRKEEELQRQIKLLNQVVSQKTQRELDLELQLKKLKIDQDRVRSNREVLLQQRLDETMAQLTAANLRAEQAQKNAGAGNSGVAYDRLNHELERTQAELKAVTKVLRQSRNELEQILTRAVKAEAGEEAYKKQLASTREQMQTEQKISNQVLATYNKNLKALEEKIKAAEQEKAAANAQLAQYKESVVQTEAQLQDVVKQRDEIKKERDQIADLVKLNDPEKTKALLDENLNLARQLKELQEQMSSQQSTATVQSAQLTQMQMEMALVKQRMIELRDENTGYRKRISQMSEKLRSTDSALEKAINAPDVDPVVVAENKLLRETISKQLRTLTVRENARELMAAAYKRLKLQDPQMENAIKMLDQGLELTAEEKQILEKQEQSRSANAVLVAPGNATPEQRAQAYQQLQMEVDALGKGATDAYTKGRYAAAEQLYQTLLDKHPGHYAAHINMGVTLLKMNRAEEAQKVLQNAVDLDPEHPTGQFLLGVALYRIGKDAGAQMALTAATLADPANAKAYFYLGNIAASSGKTAAAIKNYQRTLELDPSLIDVYYNMSSTYLNGGMVKDAQKSYDLAIRAGALPDPELEKRLKIPAPEPPPATDGKKEIKPDTSTEKGKSEETEKSDSKPAEKEKKKAN